MRSANAILALVMAAFSVASAPLAARGEFKAGVARVTITPDVGLWMAGYASRNKPAEGKLQELYAKALALEDAQGTRVVVVTSDLIGFPRSLSDAVADEVARSTGLPRANLMLTASHTHCGPVLRDNLMDIYEMPSEQMPKLKLYAEDLQNRLVLLIKQALADLTPARLNYGEGHARFAVNRRLPTANGIINSANPAGPVDHSVPVLAVWSLEGKLRAVLFGYACHNTTLQFFQWCGDYAGFAQTRLEERHPGAAAMFWAGCGGDANPLPRGTVEQCEKYGRQLAEAVDGVLEGQRSPIGGQIVTCYETISLPLSRAPSKEHWVAEALSKNYSVRTRASRFLRSLEAGEQLMQEYPAYPVQVWQLGDKLLWIALGGEVVVDYALRLKRELGKDRPVWVTAYANDVMAYIPSERVLKEGGYEGDSSMIGYGLPAKWAEGIEERIVSKVHALARESPGRAPALPGKR